MRIVGRSLAPCLGISGAVNAAGLLAERADKEAFTGDVMAWVTSRISSAQLVVADLSRAKPNVYLEVGYAWAVGIPTVLVIAKAEKPQFNLQGHTHIKYTSIKDLEQKLTAKLRALVRGGTVPPEGG
jgi:nucleoside 2-deoxyribosyltransferase